MCFGWGRAISIKGDDRPCTATSFLREKVRRKIRFLPQRTPGMLEYVTIGASITVAIHYCPTGSTNQTHKSHENGIVSFNWLQCNLSSACHKRENCYIFITHQNKKASTRKKSGHNGQWVLFCCKTNSSVLCVLCGWWRCLMRVIVHEIWIGSSQWVTEVNYKLDVLHQHWCK